MFELLTSKTCPWMCKHVSTFAEISVYTEGKTLPEHKKKKKFVTFSFAFSVPVIQITSDLEVLASDASFCMSFLNLDCHFKVF